ncbi:hypothetical protein X975_00105, partial [Stegodyphus mimosarum]
MAWELELNSARQFSTAEKEALTYVAGYIAYRVQDKDPSLGTISKNSADEPIFNSEWIKLLSLGGLTTPFHSWMNTVYEFEKIFCAVHSTTYYKGKHLIGSLINNLEKHYPEVNRDAIRLFCRVRTFIRIRFLNRNAYVFSKRKA